MCGSVAPLLNILCRAPSRSQPKPCSLGVWGSKVCTPAGSEAEVHAGGHGTVLNSRVHAKREEMIEARIKGVKCPRTESETRLKTWEGLGERVSGWATSMHTFENIHYNSLVHKQLVKVIH